MTSEELLRALGNQQLGNPYANQRPGGIILTTTDCSTASPADWSARVPWAGLQIPTPTQEKRGMFSEIAKDIKTFILEHRYIIYFIALALIVDHLIFKDVFRERLQAIVEGIIKKVENKVNA